MSSSSESDFDDDEEELRRLRQARAGGRPQQSDGPPDLGDDAFVPRVQKPPFKPPPAKPSLLDEAEEAAANDDLRLAFPISFGKTESKKSLVEVHAATRRQVENDKDKLTLQAMVKEAEAASKGLSLNQGSSDPNAGNDTGALSDEDSDEESSDDEEGQQDSSLTQRIPCANEVTMKGHTRTVSTMTLDPAGARLITGGYDFNVRLWDFNGMDANFKSFRDFPPWEGQQVVSLHYSVTGDKFLCATGKNQAGIYTRDAVKEIDFCKGDMYVHDMAQTKGHVAALVAARWHPTDRSTCMTASIDGTLRLWDVNTCDKKQITVLKCKNARGTKCIPHAATYRPNGDLLAACDDGSLKLWDGKAVGRGSTQKAHAEAAGAHEVGAEATCVAVSSDGLTALSRSRDDTLKVWDLRKLRDPVAAWRGLHNFFDTTAAIFSPGDEYILTGTSVRRAKDGSIQGEGGVRVYHRATLEPVGVIDCPWGSAVSLIWHQKLNQIFVGGSDAAVHAYYDPGRSEGGVLRGLARGAKRKDINADSLPLVGAVIAPHALPMFRDEKGRTTARQKRKDRADPVKSHKPELGPVAAERKGLRFPGTQTSRSFAQHLFKEAVGPAGQDYLQQDPREELLKYADDAAKDPKFTGVYKETQPTTIFDTSEERTEKRAKPYAW